VLLFETLPVVDLSNQSLQIMPLKILYYSSYAIWQFWITSYRMSTNGGPLVPFLFVSNEFLVKDSVPEMKKRDMQFFVSTISKDIVALI